MDGGSVTDKMNGETEKLCKDAHTMLSAQNFDHCTTSSYRNIVRQCISSTCQLSVVCTTTSSSLTSTFKSPNKENKQNQVTRHDDSVFHDVLFYSRERITVGCYRYKSLGINWAQLCNSHDASKRTLNSPEEAKKHASALEIVLEALVDQSVIPSCFALTLIEGLFSVCVEVYSSISTSMGNIRVKPKLNRPSSLKAIENAIQYIIQRSPITMVSKSIQMYIHTQIMGNLSIKDPSSEMNAQVIIQDFMKNYKTVRSDTLLSIANDLISMKVSKRIRGENIKIIHKLQSSIIVKPVISLLKEIDVMDIFLLKKSKRSNSARNDIVCTKCWDKLGIGTNKRTKRTKTTSIHDLHGEQSDDEKGLSFGNRFYYDRSNEASIVLPWKKMMKATESAKGGASTSCYVCSKSGGETTNVTALPLRFVEFRATLYQLLVDTLSAAQLVESSSALRKLLVSVFRIAVQHHMSASTRLCAIVAAHAAGLESGYIEYVTFLRKTMSTAMSNESTFRTAAVCICIYRELMKECAIFDDPVLYWRGIKFLFDMVLSLHDKMTALSLEKGIDTWPKSTMTADLIKWLLQTIGVLLLRWSTIVQSGKLDAGIQLHFNSYILRFSEAFEDKNSWLDARMSFVTQSQIVAILQKVGILSFVDESEGDLITYNGMQDVAWIYDEQHSARAAHLRMGPRVLQDQQIFTNSDRQETLTEESTKKRKNRPREDSFCGEPILDYINDDITFVIFSYLGYKLLARATSVCKSWRDIGNNNLLWETHYLRRFRPIFIETLLSETINPEMKVLFIAKHCQRENVYWRHIFNHAKEKEQSLKFNVISDGWRNRCCRVFGCNVVMKKRDTEAKHMPIHHKDVAKKLGVLERVEKRRLAKLERESSSQKEKIASKQIQKKETKPKSLASSLGKESSSQKKKNASKQIQKKETKPKSLASS